MFMVFDLCLRCIFDLSVSGLTVQTKKNSHFFRVDEQKSNELMKKKSLGKQSNSLRSP